MLYEGVVGAPQEVYRLSTLYMNLFQLACAGKSRQVTITLYETRFDVIEGFVTQGIRHLVLLPGDMLYTVVVELLK